MFSRGHKSIKQPFYNPFTEQRYIKETKKFGYYFCQKDKISIDELKIGTFEQASNFCRKLWTPHLCENRQFDEKLLQMAQIARSMNYNETTDRSVNDSKNNSRKKLIEQFDIGPGQNGLISIALVMKMVKKLNILIVVSTTKIFFDSSFRLK